MPDDIALYSLMLMYIKFTAWLITRIVIILYFQRKKIILSVLSVTVLVCVTFIISLIDCVFAFNWNGQKKKQQLFDCYKTICFLFFVFLLTNKEMKRVWINHHKWDPIQNVKNHNQQMVHEIEVRDHQLHWYIRSMHKTSICSINVVRFVEIPMEFQHLYLDRNTVENSIAQAMVANYYVLYRLHCCVIRLHVFLALVLFAPILLVFSVNKDIIV